MQMKQRKQSLSLLVCSVLLAATALVATGCGSQGSSTAEEPASVAATSEAATATADTAAGSDQATVLGQGATEFTFTVVDGDGNETAYEIHTDKQTVGDALQELDLIDGEESEYGLYVKTVNGITVDYDTDGKYWAFYVDGEYAQTGVDSTEIVPGAAYAFRVEQ